MLFIVLCVIFFERKTQRINIPGASWQDCRPQAGDGDQGSIRGHEGQRHCQTQGEHAPSAPNPMPPSLKWGVA
jgi:hypothetical protein